MIKIEETMLTLEKRIVAGIKAFESIESNPHQENSSLKFSSEILQRNDILSGKKVP